MGAPDWYTASANSALGRRISNPPLTVIATATIVHMSDGLMRYIITFICPVSRFAVAFAINAHTSRNATIAFDALCDLLPKTPSIVLSDNGSEFKGAFEKRMQQLDMTWWFTRYKTPKMNAHCERVGRTIQESFVDFYEDLLFTDLAAFNQKMAQWIIQYNA